MISHPIPIQRQFLGGVSRPRGGLARPRLTTQNFRRASSWSRLLPGALCGALAFVHAVSAREPWVAPTEASNLKNPVPASSTVLAQAKNLYADHCADCHGKKGRGDGSNAADLERKPTNLTQPALLAQGDGALFWKISEGRKPMPAYSRKLSEEQRWKLVNYIRTLAPKNNKN